MLPGLAELYWL